MIHARVAKIIRLQMVDYLSAITVSHLGARNAWMALLELAGYACANFCTEQNAKLCRTNVDTRLAS